MKACNGTGGRIPLEAAILTLAMLGCVGLLVVWLWFWPLNPLVVSKIVVPSPQRSGQPIVYDITYCLNTTHTGTVNRSIVGVNGTNYNYPFTQVPSGVIEGCRSTHITLTSPGIHTGTYRVHVAVIYNFNPIHTVTISTTSNVFQVTP